ncbi:MAG: D-alanine--D-alanine ligase family protein [Peptoniphilaceae bacterium]|nr:D-alanine--D-alanine ligase family protein [Peptoniphilaceae bacterium]
MKTILVLCGGRSTEHEIALRSARSIINGLDREKYRVHVTYIDRTGGFTVLGLLDHVEAPEDLMRAPATDRLSSICEWLAAVADLLADVPPEDVLVFPVIHGQTGEDGEIQGFLQMLGLSYVGCHLTASALCMDKAFSNEIFRANGIPEADYIVYTHRDWNADGRSVEHLQARIRESFGFPCFVKPANNGSSVGVTRATEATLQKAVELALRYDRRILIEEAIVGQELEVSILGNDTVKASLPGSYTSTHEVLDYEAKYHDRSTVENVPHPLDDETTARVQEFAKRAYRVLGCEGFARVDLFLTPDGHLYMNEINTFPGMTPTSLAPKLWTELTDMTFSQYLDEIIENAVASNASTASVRTSLEAE